MDKQIDSVKWIGHKKKGYWPKYYKKTKYVYYTQCEYKGVEYKIGCGVLLEKNNKKVVGQLLCLYEDKSLPNAAQRCRAVIEIFQTSDEFMKKYVSESHRKFYQNVEIIKSEKQKDVDVSISDMMDRCAIVYACEYEDPKDVIVEFAKKTNYPIYMCRYKYVKYKNSVTLKSVLTQDPIVITDSDDNSSSDSSECKRSKIDSPQSDTVYMVVDSKINDTDLKLKLKNQNADDALTNEIKNISPRTPQKGNVPLDSKWSPVIMLNNLRLEMTPTKTMPSARALRTSVRRMIENEPKLTRRTSTRLQTNVLYYESPDANETPEKPDTPRRQSTRKRVLPNFTDFEVNLGAKPNISESPKKTNRAPKTPKARELDLSPVGTPNKFGTPKKASRAAPKTPKARERSLSPDAMETSNKFCTPKKQVKTPRVKVGNLTPSVQAREHTLVLNAKPFEKAKAQLHVSVRNGSLPCREQEYDDIMGFVKGKLKDQAGGCMYISGVPGTGKTATVFQVMDELDRLAAKKKVTSFEFIKLNALALTEPRQIYVQIVKQIHGKLLHWEAALNFIVEFFTKKKKQTSYIMLVDELDKLCTRKQDVVYNLLDLPSRCKTPLIVLTIANTMDLPERLLANKVNSRLGLTRLTFKPYKHKELIEIVKTRLLSVENIFRNEAIEFVARKVAAVSGDARRALAICTRALEVAESHKEAQVTMQIVDKALEEMSSSSKVQAIKRCSKMEKLILSAIANEVNRTGNDEVSFISMMSTLSNLLILESIEPPSYKIALLLCHKLGSSRILISQHGRTDIELTLLLNVSSDDVHFAL